MNYKPKKNQTKQTRPIACRLGKQEQPSPSKKNRRTGKESNCVGEVPINQMRQKTSPKDKKQNSEEDHTKTKANKRGLRS